MLVPTNESKEKQYEELSSKIRDLIMLITNNSDDYNEKYIKSNSIWMTSYLWIKQ